MSILKKRVENEKDVKLTFGEFSHNWWDWDKCDYIRLKRLEGTNEKPKIKKSTAIGNRQITDKYLLPEWKDKPLCDITKSDVEKWILKLKNKGLANKTINNISSVFSVMLKQAYNSRLIQSQILLPRLSIKPFKREILTEKEFINLFCDNGKNWQDETVKIFCLTSALTGLRRGELRALKTSDIKSDFLVIDKSFSEITQSITTTKSSRSRIVPISMFLKEKLFKVSKGEFVFNSTKGNVINASRITRELTRALENIGINKTEIKKRNLTLHSLRHFANTQFVLKGIKAEIIRQVIGHQSEKMTEHYTSLNIKEKSEYESIVNIQDELMKKL